MANRYVLPFCGGGRLLEMLLLKNMFFQKYVLDLGTRTVLHLSASFCVPHMRRFTAFRFVSAWLSVLILL